MEVQTEFPLSPVNAAVTDILCRLSSRYLFIFLVYFGLIQHFYCASEVFVGNLHFALSPSLLGLSGLNSPAPRHTVSIE